MQRQNIRIEKRRNEGYGFLSVSAQDFADRLNLRSATMDYRYSTRPTFNPVGELVQLETERYMGTNDLQTWVIKMAYY